MHFPSVVSLSITVILVIKEKLGVGLKLFKITEFTPSPNLLSAFLSSDRLEYINVQFLDPIINCVSTIFLSKYPCHSVTKLRFHEQLQLPQIKAKAFHLVLKSQCSLPLSNLTNYIASTEQEQARSSLYITLHALKVFYNGRAGGAPQLLKNFLNSPLLFPARRTRVDYLNWYYAVKSSLSPSFW